MSEIKHFIPQGDIGNKAKAAVYIIVIIIVIIIALIILSELKGGLDGVLEWLGIKDSAQTKANRDTVANQQKVNSSDPNSPWNPNYWQQYQSASDPTGFQDAVNRAAAIKQSVGVIYDSPEQGEAQIKQCQRKSDVSKIAYVFANNSEGEQDDLYDYLANHYDKAGQVQVLADMTAYVNNLPNS